MSWGYKHSTGTFSQDMQSGKRLINTTDSGTKIYKSIISEGINETTVLWHDNRKTSFNSKLIIKNDGSLNFFDIPFLKTQKDIFKFAEEQLIKLKYISKM